MARKRPNGRTQFTTNRDELYCTINQMDHLAPLQMDSTSTREMTYMHETNIEFVRQTRVSEFFFLVINVFMAKI